MSEREQVWREWIEWQQWSGLTVAEYCKETGVSVASFYRWKKLLTEPQGPRRRRSTHRTEVQASGPEKQASLFVPIAVRDSSASLSPPQSIASGHGLSMRLKLPNGVVIHVSDNPDAQRLGDLIITAGQIRSVHADMTTPDLPQHEVLSC